MTGLLRSVIVSSTPLRYRLTGTYPACASCAWPPRWISFILLPVGAEFLATYLRKNARAGFWLSCSSLGSVCVPLAIRCGSGSGARRCSGLRFMFAANVSMCREHGYKRCRCRPWRGGRLSIAEQSSQIKRGETQDARRHGCAHNSPGLRGGGRACRRLSLAVLRRADTRPASPLLTGAVPSAPVRPGDALGGGFISLYIGPLGVYQNTSRESECYHA
jgi:hypothetical protein